MQKILLICLFVQLAGKSFCQRDTATLHASIKTDYLKKSKTQKTVAWVLLGTGTTMVVTGLLVGINSAEDAPPFVIPEETAAGAVLLATGVVLELVSIPFFISASKNKRRAATVGVGSDSLPMFTRMGARQKLMPSISFTVSF